MIRTIEYAVYKEDSVEMIGKTMLPADDLRELEQRTDHADIYPGILLRPIRILYSGTGTSVTVVNISNSGATMSADITVGTPCEGSRHIMTCSRDN